VAEACSRPDRVRRRPGTGGTGPCRVAGRGGGGGGVDRRRWDGVAGGKSRAVARELGLRAPSLLPLRPD
jgi:hypothetical protein